MVSDQEIASCVESLLRQANPTASTSLAGVVRQAEAKLGLDLSHKTAFIRDQIDLLLGPPPPSQPQPQPPSGPTKDQHQQHQQHQQIPPHHFAQFAPHMRQFQAAPPQLIFHPVHQISAAAAAGGSSPFAHLAPHHELAFRYPSPLPQGMAVPVGAHQFQQQQLVAHPVGSPAVRPGTAVASPKESAPTVTKRKGGPGGLSKMCGVSPELQVIVGEPAMPRTQIVKQLWAYIRKNNLQDPNNKRKIICNDELRVVFETDCTDMFKMNKLLAKHILPLDQTIQVGPDSKKVKTEDAVSAPDPNASEHSVVISDALAIFFGIGEKEMLQSEALRRVWDYIKANQLEDPTNSNMIICDSKLQQLFGCENFSALAVPEMLECHLCKKS